MWHDASQCDIFMVQYRGFGLSEGEEANHYGLQMDAQAGLDFLREKLRKDDGSRERKIFLLGHSLGGAVALDLLSRNWRRPSDEAKPVFSGVLIENTFASISSIVPELMPMYAWLTFLHDYLQPWDNVGAVQEIVRQQMQAPEALQTRLDFVLGARDEQFPQWHMLIVYQRALKGLCPGADGGESLHGLSKRLLDAPDESADFLTVEYAGCAVRLHYFFRGNHVNTSMQRGFSQNVLLAWLHSE